MSAKIFCIYTKLCCIYMLTYYFCMMAVFSCNVGAKTCLHAFQKNRNNKIPLKITDTWFFK